MFNSYKLILMLVTSLGLSAPVYAQLSSTASATTTLADPAGIAKASDLDFGLVEAGKNTSVVVSPYETTGRSHGNDAASAATPASIDITGASDQSYSIGLPREARILQRQNGKETVTVREFATGIPEGLLMSGQQRVQVGATLAMEKEQAPGLYASQAGLPVVVNYN